MQTVFVTCVRGIISRNILSTGAFEILKERRDLRVVVIAPEQRAAVLQKEFGAKNVIIESFHATAKTIEKRLERFLWTMATNLLSTKTRDVQRRVKLYQDKNRTDYVFSIAAGFFGRFRMVRTLFRAFWSLAVDGKEFNHLFERYKPVLLFATDIYTLEDAKLMAAAKRYGARTVGMVRSWDNVTSKTLLTSIPDDMVVNSDCIKEEAVIYGDVPVESIYVSGVPHYDRYRSEHCTPRGDFLKRYGITSGEKLILLATPSDRYLTDNPVTPVALKALERVNAKILVRLPLVGKGEMGSEAISVTRGNVIFDDPGTYPDFTDVHLSLEADRHLADCLNAADLVITWASTMIIDAAVFNKPVILIGFDASPRPYGQSILRFYDYEHHRPILESGAARLAKNPEELVSWVSRYLENPRLDETARAEIVNRYCGDLDGKAGKRLGDFLIRKLERYER